MNEQEWFARNETTLLHRMDPLRQRPDGVLLVEPSGAQFLIVTKQGDYVRLLLVDQCKPQSDITQAHLYLADPLHLISPYQQATMLTLLWVPRPVRIATIGLGGGRLHTVLHHHLPACQIECAEIDPAVKKVAVKFFGLPVDERLRVHLADGRRWLEQQPKRATFDLILVDAFLDQGYSPYSLTTREFYRLCRALLTPNGMIAVNILESDPFFSDRIRTAQSVFDAVALCQVPGHNAVLFAGEGLEQASGELQHRARALQEQHRFHFPLVERAREIDFDLALPALEYARILIDSEPPDHYFDSLPSFDSPFSRIAPDSPCPCGSGRPFGDCHGSAGAQKPDAT